MKQATVWVGIGGVILGLGLGYLLSAQLQKRSQAKNDPVYAIVDGEAIRASQVHASIQGDLDELEKNQYRLKRKATEEAIREIFTKRSEKNETKVAEQDLQPSKEEISQYFKALNLNPQKMTRIEYDRHLNILRHDKFQKFESQQIAELQKKSRVEWKLKLPSEKEFQMGSTELPTQGPRRAPVELVFISNLQCPFCGEAEKRLAEIQERYKDQIRLRYVFSFSEPDNSFVRATAEANHCAQDQNQFWAYHQYLVEHPVTEVKGLLQAAEAVKLKTSDFESCLMQRKKRESVMKDLETLAKSGVSPQAPGLLINGKWRAAHLPLEELSLVIDQEIQD